MTGKSIVEADFAEMRNQFGIKLDETTISDIIDSIKDELAEPGILIYCCAQCGDYLCGGVKVNMVIDEHYVKWTFGEKEEKLVFAFDKYAYLDTLKAYQSKIKNTQTNSARYIEIIT